MEALQLQLKQKAIIDFNQEQLEKYLTDVESKYSGIVVTEDNLPDIGKTRAAIGKLGKEIHSRFSEVKKQALEPISGLESSVKDAKQRVETIYRSIKDQEDAYEKKRRDSEKKRLNEIRLQILADNHVNDDYAHLVEVKDAYLNKTADQTKILDNLAEQAKNAYVVQKAAIDAEKMKQQKQKMIAKFCKLYSDKLNLTKPLQSISFNNLIDSDIDEIQAKIELAASNQHESETRNHKAFGYTYAGAKVALDIADKLNAEENKANDPKGQKINHVGLKSEPDEIKKTMNIRITASSLQRIALTEFLRESGIKFEVIINKNEA